MDLTDLSSRPAAGLILFGEKNGHAAGFDLFLSNGQRLYDF
jgi:hypothetical protein